MKVRVLPDQVINCISAGEVIERPASVVRELVDNAVDAGATEIAVYTEEGGQRLVRVVDDGCGMERDDAILAFERHATSKLKQVEDLEAISTMGFRGEALPSIAAVSKVKLISRTAAEPAGTEVFIEGGKLKDVRTAAVRPGTEVEVHSLFFNTPARRKFLKSSRSEEQRIKTWLANSALANPGVRYRLFLDGREVLNLARRGSALERARDFLKGSAVELDAELEGELKITGLVAHPALAQMDSAAMVLLVNRRQVQDRMLLRAVKEGFDSTLKDREFPVGFISLEVNPELVDVNVHPQKSEVRFRNSGAVFQAVRASVLQAVRRFRAPLRSGEMQPGRPAALEAVRYDPPPAWAAEVRSPAAVETEQGRLWGGDGGKPSDAAAEGSLSADPFRFSELRYIGQALECYLICEHGGLLYVVDMHAAHERYNYNLIRNGYRGKTIQSQQLLLPVTVELLAEGLQNCVSHMEVFRSFGLELEPFGDTTMVVRAAPAIVSHDSIVTLVKELAAISLEGTGQGTVDQALDHVAARIACHASVRSGQSLSREDVYALFKSLDSSEFSAACPHGRPVVVSFSEDEIEKWFGRDR